MILDSARGGTHERFLEDHANDLLTTLCVEMWKYIRNHCQPKKSHNYNDNVCAENIEGTF